MKVNWKAVSIAQVCVIVMIGGVLAALVLPAMQSAREAAGYASAANADYDMPTLGLPASAVVEGKPVRHASEKPADRLPAMTTGSARPDRKIIYTATIQLVAEDFATAGDKVIELVKQFEGYVADSRLLGSRGDNRRAAWKIRVPIARFDEFVASAKGLGELVSANTTSQDVSEEYYDVDARIRNKTKEEERLLKLLEERPGKLEDVIAIERELSRVREELERMQGRMRVLADRTSLTTVELEIAEVRSYMPAETPTLATRIRRSFESSLESMRSAAEGFVVFIAAISPWLAALLALAAVGYLAVRRLRSSTATPARSG